MPELIEKNCRLPACRLNTRLLTDLRNVIAEAGCARWQAGIGTGGDLLGKSTDRPQIIVGDWAELSQVLASLPHVDSLVLTAECPGQGTMVLVFRNYPPVDGHLQVSGHDAAWVNGLFTAARELFQQESQPFATKLYSKLGFAFVQTVVPISLSFILVTTATALIIPAAVRQSDLLWWITAATVIITLRLAYTISDRLMLYVLKRYPYIVWADRR